MAVTNIQVDCYKCFGVGIHSKDTIGGVVEIDPCPVCNGDKYLTISQIDLSDLDNKLDDIMDKCNDIFEKVNE